MSRLVHGRYEKGENGVCAALLRCAAHPSSTHTAAEAEGAGSKCCAVASFKIESKQRVSANFVFWIGESHQKKIHERGDGLLN